MTVFLFNNSFRFINECLTCSTISEILKRIRDMEKDSMKDIEFISIKRLLAVGPLFVMGFLVMSFADYSINWLASWVFGLFSLVYVFGIQQTKKMFKPMERPYFRKLLMLFILIYCSAIVVSGVSLYFFHTPLGLNVNSQSGLVAGESMLGAIVDYFQNLISATGEEALMASIIIPALVLLKKYTHGLFFTMFVSSVLFGVMHIFVYDFNLVSCFLVAIDRFIFNLAWLKTKSIRGGIYLHLAQDAIGLLGTII